MKLLIGISHENDGQVLRDTNNALANYKPTSVGLEYPIDPDSIGGKEVPLLGFTALKMHYQSQGKEVIPLDTNTSRKLRLDLTVLMFIKSHDLMDELHKEFDYLRNYCNKDSIYRDPWHVAAVQRELERLDRIRKYSLSFPTVHSVSRAFKTACDESENGMLERIFKTLPDVVILGGAHTHALAPKLPQYKHIQTSTYVGIDETLIPPN